MAKILVTGASGFIGRHCLPALQACGHDVHAVSKAKRLDTITGVTWHNADLLQPDELRRLVEDTKPTHLLHLAWYAQPGKFWTAAENLQWVQASLELIQAFASVGGQRMVVAGTCAEYSWRHAQARYSESTSLLAPSTLYGASKHALHVTLEPFARQVGFTYAWARVFFPYGPYEDPQRLIAYAVRSMLQREVVNFTHGRQVRDLLYVEDVASALVALLNSNVSGAVNIASGEGVALKDVIHKVATRLNARELVRLDALAERSDDPPMLVADIGRLHDEVGFAPRYTLDAGIDKTIEWWKLQQAG